MNVSHAYALMTHHVRLLLTPARKDSASLLMKLIGQHYMQLTNRQYRCSRMLWEGRFRSCLAQREEYVPTCCRYIELKPDRAGMVAHPRGYTWSSYRYNAKGRADSLVISHHDYDRLGGSDSERRAAYQRS